MKVPFTKMHGLGNDFILVDCRNLELGTLPAFRQAENPELKTEYLAYRQAVSELGTLAEHLCHRRFGIGADQLLLLYTSDIADFKMRIFNADGSEVEMCGNGIRCFARYIWDRGLSEKDMLSVETMAGIIKPIRAGDMVTVDMGEPVLEGRLIPVNIPPHPPLDKGGNGGVKDFHLKIENEEFKITCVSMGNPHAVIVVDEVDAFNVKRYGPLIEVNRFFPKRTNVEFIQIITSERIKMRVWERGSGETMACGTGASAVAVAANLLGLAGRRVCVELPGGELLIEWKEDNRVYMTGPAVEVFSGEILIGTD
jgi:diaminopimelate epimerase